LLAGGTEQQFEEVYSGSPVINAQGQVVAIYSRPTPVQSGANETESDFTFDAPLFERVRECLAE
jgi:hypothetical protein